MIQYKVFQSVYNIFVSWHNLDDKSYTLCKLCKFIRYTEWSLARNIFDKV